MADRQFNGFDPDWAYRPMPRMDLIFWIVVLYGSLDNARDQIAKYGERYFIDGLSDRIKMREGRFRPPPYRRPQRKDRRVRDAEGRFIGKKVS